MLYPATGELMPESMDFNGGNSTGFQQCCISALDYPRLHASGSSRQNICGAIFTKTFRIKQQLVWQWNFPVGMFCLRRAYIQNGFWNFSCVRIGSLIQIFDADHSTLYADLVLGEIHIFPAQAAEFAYTDAGMHAKQQTEMKIADIVNKKFLQLVIVCKLHNLHLLAGASQMGVADWFTGIDASLCCKVQNAAEYA